jgi:hypothetical protein
LQTSRTIFFWHVLGPVRNGKKPGPLFGGKARSGGYPPWRGRAGEKAGSSPSGSSPSESAVDFEQQMEVIGNKGEAAHADAVTSFCPGEGADDDLVERMAGEEEQQALEGPAGHLHQGVFLRDEAE